MLRHQFVARWVHYASEYDVNPHSHTNIDTRTQTHTLFERKPRVFNAVATFYGVHTTSVYTYTNGRPNGIMALVRIKIG